MNGRWRGHHSHSRPSDGMWDARTLPAAHSSSFVEIVCSTPRESLLRVPLGGSLPEFSREGSVQRQGRGADVRLWRDAPDATMPPIRTPRLATCGRYSCSNAHGHSLLDCRRSVRNRSRRAHEDECVCTSRDRAPTPPPRRLTDCAPHRCCFHRQTHGDRDVTGSPLDRISTEKASVCFQI